MKGGEKQMTKIISGVAGLVATVALVGTAAFASFSAEARLDNIAFATGTSGLEVTLINADPQASPSLSPIFDGGGGAFGESTFSKMLPGQVFAKELRLRNVGDVQQTLSMRLVSSPEGWEELSELILVKFMSGNFNSEYQTLAWWNSQDRPFGDVLTIGQERVYAAEFKLAENAGNAAKDKKVNTNWVINGTQFPAAPTPTAGP